MASLNNAMENLRINLESPISLDKYPAKQHAKRVASILGVDKGLIYLPGTPTIYLEDSDQAIPFRQRRFFYYLSGVDEADCHLIYDIGYDLLALYVPQVSPKEVIWNGRGSNPAEALDRYDVDHVEYSNLVAEHVDSWLDHCKDGHVYILHPDQGTRKDFDKSPRVNSTDLKKAMDIARLRKDAHEIKLIKRANDISAKAHTNVLKNIAKFTNEAQVEAIFLDTCVAEDAKHQAYDIIAASGGNAATLHYVENNEDFNDRQLMVLDAGAEWDCYASDVTRTFPLKGDWPSIEAKDIYHLVQSMQTACINAIKPGVRFIDLQNLAHRVAIWGLLKLGILHDGSLEEIFQAKTSMAFFPHGLGHHVGLDVHDIINLPMTPCGKKLLNYDLCGPNPNPPPFHPMACGLEEGMVVTMEPGIYFSEFALRTLYLPNPVHAKYINMTVVERYFPVGGVRIEDDILVTDTGHENLTTAPKGDEALKIIQESIQQNSNNYNAAPLTSHDSVPVVEGIPSPRKQIRNTRTWSFGPAETYPVSTRHNPRPSSAHDVRPPRLERPITRDAFRNQNPRCSRYERPRSGPMRPTKPRDAGLFASHLGECAGNQEVSTWPYTNCSAMPQVRRVPFADLFAVKVAEAERESLRRSGRAPVKRISTVDKYFMVPKARKRYEQEAAEEKLRNEAALPSPCSKPTAPAKRTSIVDKYFVVPPKAKKDQAPEPAKEKTGNDAAPLNRGTELEAERQKEDETDRIQIEPYSARWLEYINHKSVSTRPRPHGLAVAPDGPPGLQGDKQ